MNKVETPATSGCTWFKSSYSGGERLETAADERAVRVRESKALSRSPLTVSPDA